MVAASAASLVNSSAVTIPNNGAAAFCAEGHISVEERLTAARFQGIRVAIAGMRRIEDILDTEQLVAAAYKAQLKLLDQYQTRIQQRAVELESNEEMTPFESSQLEATLMDIDELHARWSPASLR